MVNYSATLGALLLLLAKSSHATDHLLRGIDNDVQSTIALLADKVEALERDNAALKEELGEHHRELHPADDVETRLMKLEACARFRQGTCYYGAGHTERKVNQLVIGTGDKDTDNPQDIYPAITIDSKNKPMPNGGHYIYIGENGEDDEITIGGDGDNEIRIGGEGEDTIVIGGPDGDTINIGGAGPDDINIGGGGADTINLGGQGGDYIYIGAAGDDTIDIGGEGYNDLLIHAG